MRKEPPAPGNFVPGRGSQSSSYLTQSAESLCTAGDARFLFADVPPYLEGSVFAPLQRSINAVNRRLRALRASVLFSAFAAEAYANEFLSDVLSPAELNAVDGLQTIEKLLLGPSIAGLSSPLRRDRDPAQTIQQLFKVRNKLVHPRSSSPSAYIHSVTPEDETEYGPVAACRYLFKVAEAIVLMDGLRGTPGIIGEATLLSTCPQVCEDHLAQIGDSIDFLVAEDSPAPSNVIELAQQRLAQERS